MAGHGDLAGRVSHGDVASVAVFGGFVSKGLRCAAIKHLSLHAMEQPPLLTTVMDNLLFFAGHTLDTGLQHPANNSGHLPPL